MDPRRAAKSEQYATVGAPPPKKMGGDACMANREKLEREGTGVFPVGPGVTKSKIRDTRRQCRTLGSATRFGGHAYGQRAQHATHQPALNAQPGRALSKKPGDAAGG